VISGDLKELESWAIARRSYVCSNTVVVELRRTGRGQELVEVAPSQCPNGHRLAPHEVLVAYLPCWCARTGGHRSYWCRACETVIFDPPHSADAEMITGYARPNQAPITPSR
jgi:hypothetical protein